MSEKLPEKIPTVEEFARCDIAEHYPWVVPRLRESAAEHPFRALLLALAENDYARADRVMAEQRWTPLSKPDPDAGNWHKDATLMFYGCWGNEKSTPPELMARLYVYLRERDPEAIFSRAPSGDTMLRAWTNGAYDLSILQDLLERGVDPLAKDNEGRTVMDFLSRFLKDNSRHVSLAEKEERTGQTPCTEAGEPFTIDPQVRRLVRACRMVEAKIRERTHSAAGDSQWQERFPPSTSKGLSLDPGR